MIIETKCYGDTIFFDEESHKFWKMDGENKVKIESVTKFTGIIDKSQALIPWAVKLFREFLNNKLPQSPITAEDIYEGSKQHTIKKKEAGNTGTQIHDLVEKWIKKEKIDFTELPDQVRNGFDAFLKFQSEHNFQWIESEKIVYSLAHNYAGILDAIAIDGEGKKVLVDFKSSNALYPEYVLQAAGYQQAVEEMAEHFCDYKLLIRFGKEDGEFEAKKFTENLEDKQGFLHALELTRAMARLKASF